jgi:hypothetical protein
LHQIPADIALGNHNSFPAFKSQIFNLDLDFSRWNGPISQIKSKWERCYISIIRLFLKRAPAKIICQELEATTWTGGNVVGDAAKDGQQNIVELFVRAGAKLELDRGAYGTPLFTACAFGRFQTVKYLVRAGAKIVSKKGGRPFSAIVAARSFPDIVQWLLVERHMEQRKIEYSNSFEEQPVCQWSGVQCVKVEAAGLYLRLYLASSLDRAKELAKVQKQLRGEVVCVYDETEGRDTEN